MMQLDEIVMDGGDALLGETVDGVGGCIMN